MKSDVVDFRGGISVLDFEEMRGYFIGGWF